MGLRDRRRLTLTAVLAAAVVGCAGPESTPAPAPTSPPVAITAVVPGGSEVLVSAPLPIRPPQPVMQAEFRPTAGDE